MKQHFEEMVLAALLFGLIALLPGTVAADSETVVTGVVAEDGQLIGKDGAIYEIAENEISNEINENVGKQVRVEGLLMESEEVLIITVTNFELLE